MDAPFLYAVIFYLLVLLYVAKRSVSTLVETYIILVCYYG